jgi:uncharacterized protein YndB with AHSA1/START domain
MRLVDRPAVSVCVGIPAPPSAIWELITDLDAPGQWSPEYNGGTWLDGATGPRLGARFEGRNSLGERSWTSTSTVTACLPGVTYAWATGDADAPGAVWRYDLIQDGERTIVRHTAVLCPGASGTSRYVEKHPDREDEIVTRRLEMLQTGMAATLAGLRTALGT